MDKGNIGVELAYNQVFDQRRLSMSKVNKDTEEKGQAVGILMTKKQVDHLDCLIEQFRTLATNKYSLGAKEHGGNLWDKGIMFLVEEAILENIDQFIYLMTLRQQLLLIPLPKPKAIDIDKDDPSRHTQG